ncbi:MAG: OsmC family protein [Chitinophagaceae bacterium]|jgi:putative redox protein|nr:OsmC family protein [Chitinophagaceae bacterium]
MLSTKTSWVSALAFDATADSGHTVRLDTTVEGGGLGSGMNPKKMLLASLSGCSGMDVVDILQKMKIPFTKLEIEASAEQTDEHPKVFKFINMVYRCDVAPEHIDKLNRAVSLSQEKYCGVSAMLAKHCAIHYTTELL